MKTLNYVKVVLLLVLTIVISSCEVDDYNIDEVLCDKYWTKTYYTNDGKFCTHELIFYLDGGGKETFIYQYRVNGNSYEDTDNYYFDWNWTDNRMNSLDLRYNSGTILYFDDVVVSDHSLSGIFDGTEVIFRN